MSMSLQRSARATRDFQAAHLAEIDSEMRRRGIDIPK
jgi:hypothetical protein